MTVQTHLIWHLLRLEETTNTPPIRHLHKMSTAPLTISPALPADVPVFISISITANLSNTNGQSVFLDWPKITTQEPFFRARIAQKFSDPNSSVFKIQTLFLRIYSLACLGRESVQM